MPAFSQSRSPRASARERRNAQAFQVDGLIVISPLEIASSGAIKLVLAADGGLESGATGLKIKLDASDQILRLGAAGLRHAFAGFLPHEVSRILTFYEVYSGINVTLYIDPYGHIHEISPPGAGL